MKDELAGVMLDVMERAARLLGGTPKNADGLRAGDRVLVVDVTGTAGLALGQTGIVKNVDSSVPGQVRVRFDGSSPSRDVHWIASRFRKLP